MGSLEDGAPEIAPGTRYSCTNNAAITAPSSDIFSFTAYSLQQCLDACTQYNYMSKSPPCDAIVIEGNLNSGVKGRYKLGNGANCWLKQGALESSLMTTQGSTAVVIK